MKAILLLATTITLLACNQQRRSTVPQEFECFNSPRVFIKYKQPINGYTVKAMWLPYVSQDGTTGETGLTTLLHFKSADNEFTINLEAKHIIDTLCYHYPHLKDGDVLYWDYVPKDSNEVLPNYSPFSFYDVDFDGKEELLITNYQNGSYSNNTYKVYKIHEYYAELMTDEPFNHLETSTKFDSINKTIITTSTGGQGSVYTYTYQLKGYETMYGDKPMTIPKFELVQADITDDKGHRVYQRKGDKLERLSNIR